MARVLSVASTEMLKTTRQLLLEQEGHFVLSAVSPEEVEKLGQTEKLDLALIGHGFRGPDKRKIAQTINQYSPGLPILEMCFHSPEIPGADFLLSDSPADLVRAINHILAGRRIRGYTE